MPDFTCNSGLTGEGNDYAEMVWDLFTDRVTDLRADFPNFAVELDALIFHTYRRIFKSCDDPECLFHGPGVTAESFHEKVEADLDALDRWPWLSARAGARTPEEGH